VKKMAVSFGEGTALGPHQCPELRQMKVHLVRLPDINSNRDLEGSGYQMYGRLALLRGGVCWFGDLHSSHPANTQIGWYWAIGSQGDLYVSARGAGLDGEILIHDRRDILAWLIAELVRRRLMLTPDRLQIIA
jgi:hypothetical protein